MNGVLIAIVAYVLVQFAVGAWVSRRMTSEADYILAGRRLGAGLVVFSVFATYFGAEAIVASGGSVYEKGLAGGLVDPFGYAAAIIIVGAVLRPGAVVARADHLRRPVPPALFAGRRAPGGDHPAAGLGDLGGRAGARVRPGAERQLGPRPRHGHHAGGGAGGRLLGRWRPARRRRHRHHPGHRRGGRPRHPAAVVVSGMGGVSARRWRRSSRPGSRSIDHEESLLATLEHLAIPSAARSWPWS